MCRAMYILKMYFIDYIKQITMLVESLLDDAELFLLHFIMQIFIDGLFQAHFV